MSAPEARLGAGTVLFDLDGTLADTAPDLGHVLNLQRLARGLEAMPLELEAESSVEGEARGPRIGQAHIA